MNNSTSTAEPAAEPVLDVIDSPVPDRKPHHAARAIWQRFRKPVLLVGGIVVAIVVAYYIYDALTHEETDDAYVTGHLHDVSARIAESVTNVYVDDNQFVRKGDVLVTLDPSNYLALEAA